LIAVPMPRVSEVDQPVDLAKSAKYPKMKTGEIAPESIH
jgi:hypothetical protein